MTETDIKSIQRRLSALEKENRGLRQEINSYKQYVENLKKKPNIIGSVESILKDGRVMVTHAPGNRVLLPANPLMNPMAGDSVALHAQTFQIVEVLSK